MADFEYGASIGNADLVRGREVITLVNWLGAAISVALIAGLAVWGYKLMVRDVSGIPVVRALEAPMRVAPDDPGGLDAQHQGLAVNKIAADGQAAAPADRLVLAPAAASLDAEDLTALGLKTDELLNQSTDALATDRAVAQALSSLAEAGEVVAVDDAVESGAVLAGFQVGETGADAPETGQLPGIIPPTAIPSDIAGVARSPRPPPRSLKIASLGAAIQTTGAGGVVSADPASVAVGTRLAQLGAFESVEIAQQEWRRIAAQFDDFMGGKIQVIQQAESGGKLFYRLRAMGFDDISDARRFCSALLAQKAACIPVIAR
jgi:hypothetical protein